MKSKKIKLDTKEIPLATEFFNNQIRIYEEHRWDLAVQSSIELNEAIGFDEDDDPDDEYTINDTEEALEKLIAFYKECVKDPNNFFGPELKETFESSLQGFELFLAFSGNNYAPNIIASIHQKIELYRNLNNNLN